MQKFLLSAVSLAVVLQAGQRPSIATRRTEGECLKQYGSGYGWTQRIGGWSRQQTSADGAVTTGSNQAVSSAVLISIKYIKNYKVLEDHMAKEQYILTQCGTTPPTTAELLAEGADAALPTNYTRKFFTIPLQAAISGSTPQLGFIDILGVQDRFTHVSQYATGACWQKALGCNAKFESNYGNRTLQGIQVRAADAYFMDCTSTFPINCRNVNAVPNGIHVATTQDGGNVRGAEYVKFVAAFFNKEKEANEAFAQVQRKYDAAKRARGSRTAPKVAWISYSSWGSAYFEISNDVRYKGQFTTATGARSFNGTAARLQIGNSPLGTKMTVQTGSWGFRQRLYLSQYNNSKADAAAAFFRAFSDVDVVIDETYSYNPNSYTFNSFLSTYNLQANSNLKFIRNRMVLRLDGTLSARNGMDWFESRVAHPDWAVDGLARALYNDTSLRFRYFRNIAIGETPRVIRASACTKELPVCNSTDNPAPIRATLEQTVLQQGAGGLAFYGYAIVVAIAAAIVA